ncbi:MAG: hypothetical protein KR126chlam6_00856 [Candidatus Anoxychlamydiales bacterium]|nr:hypothetical protein [Candidatus Anoxychlamydiales bacterium]
MTTAVAASIPHPHIQHDVVFGDKYFKFARVTIDSTCKLYIALFYKALSYSTWIFSKDYYAYYKNKAIFYFAQAISKPYSYSITGDKIIEFSLNMFSSLKNRDFVKVKKFEDLKSYYGKDTISLWESVGTEKIPLKKDSLDALKDLSDGCCAGISLDFISNYLKEIKAGKTPIDAIKSISYRFKKGASKEAELAQIFYQFLDDSAFVAAKIKKASEHLEESSKKFFESLKQLEDIQNLDELYKASELLIEETRKSGQEQMNNLAYGKSLTYKPIAKKFGLNIQKPNTLATTIKDKDRVANFKEFVQNLPNGAYLVQVPEHAFIFIKTDNDSYIFDPIFGSFRIKLEDNTLFNLCKDYFFIKRRPTEFINFNKCELI